MNLLLKLKGYAIGLLAFIGAVLGAFVLGSWRGRKDGANSVNAGNAQSTIKAVEGRSAIEAKIAKQPPGTSAQVLRDKWSRD